MRSTRSLDFVHGNVCVRVSPLHEFPLRCRTSGSLTTLARYCPPQFFETAPHPERQVGVAVSAPLAFALIQVACSFHAVTETVAARVGKLCPRVTLGGFKFTESAMNTTPAANTK